MKRTHRILQATVTAMALCAGSMLQADEVFFDTISTEKAVRMHGAYFGVFGGGVAGVDGEGTGTVEGATVSGGGGWLLGTEIGYSFQTAWPVRPAIEAELFYLDTDADLEGGGFDATANYRSVNLFVNAVLSIDLWDYENDLGPFVPRLRPYIGGGIGAAYVDVDATNVTLPDGSKTNIGGGDDIRFAWQLFAGLEVALAEDFSIYGEYKYLVYDKLPGSSLDDIDHDLWTVGFKVQY